jgi:hypothetical protein
MDDVADVIEEQGQQPKHTVAPLIMKGVEIDWDNRVLTNQDAVLNCISELLLA